MNAMLIPRKRGMPKTPDYFVGKTIVITGAGAGIGRATALIFAREGANVVVIDIDAEAARRAAETVGQGGGQALAVRADVTSVSRLRRLRSGDYSVWADQLPVQFGWCRGEPLQVPGDRRRAAEQDARDQSAWHVLRYAGGYPAYAGARRRRHRQCLLYDGTAGGPGHPSTMPPPRALSIR